MKGKEDTKSKGRRQKGNMDGRSRRKHEEERKPEESKRKGNIKGEKEMYRQLNIKRGR